MPSRNHQAEFVPTCPACGYDLTGTPTDVCPECGKAFDRGLVWSGWYQRERSGWPQNGVLVASVFWAANGYGFHGPEASLRSWAWFGVAWALAAAWIVLRRREIMGRKPWLMLWLWLVAVTAPGRPSFTTTEAHIAITVSVGFAAIATAFALVRSPRTAVRGILYTFSVLAWIVAVAFTLGPLLWLVGVVSESDGGGYTVLAWKLPHGGWNELLAAGIGIGFGVTGWLAWHMGTRVVMRSRA